MIKLLFRIALVALCLRPGTTICAEVNFVEVSHKKGMYTLSIIMTVNADAETIKSIMTDYEKLTSINPYLKESKIVNISDDERTSVNMLSEICVFFICYNIRHPQIFLPVNNNTLFSRFIPGMSDFKSGWGRWKIDEKDSNRMSPVTQIIFDTEISPDFFIPPVFGPYQMKKKMLDIAEATINNLEEKAQQISTR
ncbi:MAG: hypothetical protein ACI9ZT_000843 [Gammaproteobacteria bacterium]